ncbi:hypothetical protein [Streptomyces sp. NPDC050164]|uniref:hypothetical protein n=1 Tax=Streptomyces sp. NPDC050164 TaxID=3365605 RepID=UPI0037BDC07B
MARLVVDGEDVVVRLALREGLSARRREVRVPLADVRAVRVEGDWWRSLRGMPLGGRCRPGRWCVGERLHPLGRDFVAVRAGVPVVVVDLWRPVPYTRLAVSVADAEQAAEALRRRSRR